MAGARIWEEQGEPASQAGSGLLPQVGVHDASRALVYSPGPRSEHRVLGFWEGALATKTPHRHPPARLRGHRQCRTALTWSCAGTQGLPIDDRLHTVCCAVGNPLLPRLGCEGSLGGEHGWTGLWSSAWGSMSAGSPAQEQTGNCPPPLICSAKNRDHQGGSQVGTGP